MVATLRSISSSGNASRYFYFTENNFESGKAWVETKGLGLVNFGALEKEKLEASQLEKHKLEKNKLARDDFENILNGKFTTKDGELVELGRKEGGKLKHHPGQELILSAPKSVSIMALIAGDKRIIEAHEKAVDTIIDYVESNLTYTRVKKNGKLNLERTDNLIAAKYTHIAARASKTSEDKRVDPQLHTHTIIANATLCCDGKWRSIVFDKLYENKMHLGELYRIELAHSLQKLGYQIDLEKDKSDHWTFEINGVPKADIKAFSKRREVILDVAADLGVRDSESLARIAKSTREEKSQYSTEELKQDWENRISDLSLINNLKELSLGFKAASLTEVELEKQKILMNEFIEYASAYLSEREAVFAKEELIKVIINKSKIEYSLSYIEKAIAEIKKDILIKSPNDQNNFTTAKAIKSEKLCIASMQKELGTTKAIMSQKEVTEALKGANLNIGQQDAVVLSLTTKDRIIGIQGSAGAGKTTVLKQIKELASTKDYQLLGEHQQNQQPITSKKQQI